MIMMMMTYRLCHFYFTYFTYGEAVEAVCHRGRGIIPLLSPPCAPLNILQFPLPRTEQGTGASRLADRGGGANPPPW